MTREHESTGPDVLTHGPGERQSAYERVAALVGSPVRRGAQAAGFVALGAGLAVVALTHSGVLSSDDRVGTFCTAAGCPATAPSLRGPSVPPKDDLMNYWDAYDESGYNEEDLRRLAALWHMNPNDVGLLKAEVGRRLLAGETLPVPPHAAHAEPSATSLHGPVSVVGHAAYDYDEAANLARLWHLPSPWRTPESRRSVVVRV